MASYSTCLLANLRVQPLGVPREERCSSDIVQLEIKHDHSLETYNSGQMATYDPAA